MILILHVKLLLGRGAAVPRQGAVHQDVCCLEEVIAVGKVWQQLILATIDLPVAAVETLQAGHWKYVMILFTVCYLEGSCGHYSEKALREFFQLKQI